ncbi:hypothetical protein GQ464_000025 [Rhodocaloribacter litoris]|uniref:glycosyl hydrolase n=1 Tax=Rhodocaloribacter litoris TaxID=2558931 RepID=UPI00142001D9|nr:glycosyl hydrolase [Rhodocaloribacter litoris]QXD15381.1 hypothetical protein GQ464_000025 [Rhodocaloribacter litoris]
MLRRLLPFLLLIGSVPALAQTPAGNLEQGFRNPPEAARPRVWWHWMNGNVTREGITADLEWMKRAGIGGFQQFDVDLGNFLAGEFSLPTYVEERVVYRTPAWQELLRHAAAEAKRLGLEMTMHSSAGWSETGGPWVRPEQAMKKVVWSDTILTGGRHFTGRLPHPPTVTGPFHDLPRLSPLSAITGAEALPTYYEDVAVLAYRNPVPGTAPRPRLEAATPDLDLSRLADGNLLDPVALPFEEGGHAWIRLTYDQPVTVYALTLVMPEGFPPGLIQASQDGITFTTIAAFPGQTGYVLSHLPVQTFAFAPTTARTFRVVFTGLPPTSPFAQFLGAGPRTAHAVAELTLHTTPRAHRWEAKAGYDILFDYEPLATPPVPAGVTIDPAGIVDLTTRMRPDGTLDWEVPEGEWVVLRLGASLTGATNNPAPPEGRGLEVDKLSAEAVRAYIRDYMAPVEDALGDLVGEALQYLLIDSWEAGLQNWTPALLAAFEARRGYDPRPYLPALTGRIVGSAEITDRFLYDYRLTIADLLAENHYGVIDAYLAERGMSTYGEAAGANNAMFQDALRNKGIIDIPMGEFWTLPAGETRYRPEHITDIREAASAAHIHGVPIVAAESFTTMAPGWSEPPSALKPLGDHYLARGVTRFVLHTSVHQPLPTPPGFTLFVFGQHINRHTTWAEMAGGWLTYLARASYLLQQGRHVADLAYFIGEGIPATVFYGEDTTPDPEPPEGYAYDYLNADVLLRSRVEDGMLVLPSGMRYRVLVLPHRVDGVSPAVMRHLRDLVAAGATVVGAPPRGTLGLTGYPAADAEVRALTAEVWGDTDGRVITEHAYGQGRVYWGTPLEEVLAAMDIAPDVETTRPHFDTRIDWIHRQTDDGTDLYFVSNQTGRALQLEARFRVAGREAEVWDPVTATITPASYIIEDGRTTVPLDLEPYESVFVVFRRPTDRPSRSVPALVRETLMTLEGPWTVSFQENRGAPDAIRMDRLASWTEHDDPGVKYFSGVGTYTKTIEVPAAWLAGGARLELDLGDVREVARVRVNGDTLGVAWTPPFRVDVTGALRPGRNEITIEVANLWTNRLVGEALGRVEPITFTTYPGYVAGSPLLGPAGLEGQLRPAGLLGPVTLHRIAPRPAN